MAFVNEEIEKEEYIQLYNSFNLKKINFIRTGNLTIEKIIPYIKRTKIYFFSNFQN